ncbi:WXG100 family type VII secretion target [Nocardioides conyzicola]|uniref:ESAT-6-like protein n=1 Tax=Nocardioides conyzicola TaxID=1651781 RepID=A0ABP8X153_9ACTN
MAGFSSFEVDLDLLDETVAEMARCRASLDDLLDEVARRVSALQVTWGGLAAVAQQGSQAEWEAGCRQMGEALASMRTAGRVAHGSYGDAAATNLRMWEQVS